jgi:hypothetical protein
MKHAHTMPELVLVLGGALVALSACTQVSSTRNRRKKNRL